jgi:hypothetical protein
MSKVPVDFRMLEDFSKDSAALDGLIDELQSSSPGAASVAAFIQRGWPQIRSMLVRFEQIGPKAFQNLTGKPAGSRDGGAFRWPGSNHPLVRIALAMLFMKESGIPLDAEQQKYLTYFERTRADLLDKGRAAARSGRF